MSNLMFYKLVSFLPKGAHMCIPTKYAPMNATDIAFYAHEIEIFRSNAISSACEYATYFSHIAYATIAHTVCAFCLTPHDFFSFSKKPNAMATNVNFFIFFIFLKLFFYYYYFYIPLT